MTSSNSLSQQVEPPHHHEERLLGKTRLKALQNAAQENWKTGMPRGHQKSEELEKKIVDPRLPTGPRATPKETHRTPKGI